MTDWNNNLYRGIIVENNRNNEYLVYLFDWGNRHVTKLASVDRPRSFWEVPAAAIPVVPSGWEKVPPNKQELVTQILLDYLKSEITCQNVEFISGPNNRIILREFIKYNINNMPTYTINIPQINNIINDIIT